MSDSAIGLIETRGMIGVLEAADTAAKAADVQLLGVERIGGGLVSVRFRGDTASVQAAVRAASEAVRKVSELVSAHVIPSPAIDVERALATAASSTTNAILPNSMPPETGPPETGPPETVGPAAGGPATALTPEDLQSLPVSRLRQLARKTPGVGLQGRQISRA
ncbi:MAG: BMC domain-containing protein, partial [Gemmatimonadetes bacterium]|nr:BMC domain-containing protein [Gemmatimonadota bacterium]